MITPEQFVRALALTESDDNPQAWGDAGRAVGRFQVHPDWVWTWAKHYGISPVVGDTWDSFVSRIVTAFANDHLRYMKLTEVAMYFHLGHYGNPSEYDWDDAYAKRFQTCVDRVTNA